MKNKKSVILICALILVAAVALIISFNLPQSGDVKPPENTVAELNITDLQSTEQADEQIKSDAASLDAEETEQNNSAQSDAVIPPEPLAKQAEIATNQSVPSPTPAEPESTAAPHELTCTLSVRCDTVLNNMSRLNAGKTEIIPSNGIIYAERTVKFNDGESVFNVLMREMKLNKIHMEFENTPLYEGAYIEGIGNLYEFDCGELSGWMYKVNGVFPNYACSQYKLSAGDKIEWVYSCDLGEDVGGRN